VARAPASLTANVLDGTVRVTTNAPGHAPATITLDQAASGAVLALAPASGSTVAFGNVVAGSPESQSYSVTNTGNIAATVTVAATGSGFTAAVPGSGSIPANGVAQTGSITQTVASRGTQTGTFTLSTTTNRCQTAAPGSLNLTATAQAPVMTVGTVPAMSLQCGGTASGTVTFAVNNTGDTPLTLSTPIVSSGFTLLTTLPITIAAGASANLQVRAAAAVIGTDRGGTSRTGTLRFNTNEIGAPQRTINLSAAINGANIDFEFPFGTRVTSLAFTANAACPVDRVIGIRNSGNQRLNFLAWGFFPTHFHLRSPSPASFLDPGGFTSTTVEVFVTDQQCMTAAAEQIQFATSGTNVCSPARVMDIQGQIVAQLPATFSITNQSTCFCT
jgi:hypothetical protein